MAESDETAGQSVQGIDVVPARPVDGPRAAVTLAAAFATDPHVVGMLPHGDVTASLTRLWTRILRETFGAGGLVDLAVRAGQWQPVGVALWEAPGGKVSLRQMLPGLVGYLRIFRTRFPDAARTEYLTQRAHPREPHWYLKALATLPDAQGTGVGSLLLHERLATVDRQCSGAYLEASTEDLVPYYERFGFAPRGPVPCRGTVPATGMWRSPVA